MHACHSSSSSTPSDRLASRPPAVLSPDRACVQNVPVVQLHSHSCRCVQIIPWYSYTVDGAYHLLVLSISTLVGLYCYTVCVFVDPGRVPRGWQPELEAQEGPSLQEVKRGGGHR